MKNISLMFYVLLQVKVIGKIHHVSAQSNLRLKSNPTTNTDFPQVDKEQNPTFRQRCRHCAFRSSCSYHNYTFLRKIWIKTDVLRSVFFSYRISSFLTWIRLHTSARPVPNVKCTIPHKIDTAIIPAREGKKVIPNPIASATF